MKREQHSNRTIGLPLALAAAVATTVALQGSAATLYVSQTSPNPTPPYSTSYTAAHNIQDAVDAASDGDTVLVAPGDYGVTNQITVTNAIRLQSTDGPSQTFLTGNAYINQGLWCLAISNALAVADGFTLRLGTGDPGGAILVGGTIQNCNFTNFYVSFGSILMSGGTVSNAIVAYTRAPQGAAVHCNDSGLVTDSQILGHGPTGYGGTAIALVNSRLQNSVISGVPGSGNGAGAAVSALSSTVVGCTISNNFNVEGFGGGAYLQDSLMDRCIVTGNVTGGDGLGTGGGGIFETNSIIRNSLIISNSVRFVGADPSSGTLGGGVYMQGGALLNCTVSGNSAQEYDRLPGGGGGVFAESGGITNCIIYFNSLDVDRGSTNWLNEGPAIFDHCCTAPDPGGAGNITQDPQFIDMTNGNFHLASTSPCIGAGIVQPWMTGAQDLDGHPRTTGGNVDMGAYQYPGPSATHYVSQTSPNPTPPYSTPDTAAHNIQDAVDVASDGDTVLVEPGDYGVTNQITVTNAIRLQSTGGTNQTFLTGYGSWCLVISNALAVADGFTFGSGTGASGGANLFRGTIQNCNFTNYYAGLPGAIVMSGGTVSNAIVTYIRGPQSQGSGVVCSDSGLVTDSLILCKGTVGFGGRGITLANSRLQNSVISGAPAAPITGGVAVYAISSTIVSCTISNNYNRGQGGGAYLQGSLMDRCIVTGNTSGGDGPGDGGGGIFETNSIIRNSLIFNNGVVIGDGGAIYGGYGGGVYMQSGALLNCTVSGNSAVNYADAPGAGAGIYVEGNGVVTNSIVYFNSITGDSASSSNWFNTGSAIFDHSCTAPDPGGAGNITQDPQFIDMTNGNFHLASTSPCIGTGVVQSWMTDAQDLDGNPRTANGRVDMGAYQSQYPPPSILSITRSGPNVVLRWPSAGTSGFALEYSQDLSTPESWAPTEASVSDDGTNKFVTLPATNNAEFFRLR